MRRAALAAALAACGGGGGAVIAPVIDLPPAGSEADPLPLLDEVELSVARAGADAPLVSATFTQGEPLELDGVPFEDELVVHLVGRAGGVEVAYGRTCAFDLTEEGEPPAPHLWFTRTVHWAPAPAPQVAREGGAAWTTADGGLAVALGGDGDDPTIERFDPRAATWSSVSGAARHAGGVVAGFGDGRGALIGGLDDGGAPQPRVEIVDPLAQTDPIEVREDARLAVVDPAAATLETGDVVVIGGRGATGPVDAVWVLGFEGASPLPPRQVEGRLAVPRSGHTVTRISDDVGARLVVIGGVGAPGEPVAAAELYRPQREAFSETFGESLVIPRSGHAAIRMPDGSVLVVGGVDAAGAAVPTMELFTIDGGFAPVGDLPGGTGLVDVTLTALPDGRVLLAGGRATPAGAPSTSAHVIRLDPSDGSVDVVPTDDLDAARAGHAAATLCDGTVLVVGGSGAPSAVRYQPPSFGRR